jgi:hypothetical protein
LPLRIAARRCVRDEEEEKEEGTEGSSIDGSGDSVSEEGEGTEPREGTELLESDEVGEKSNRASASCLDGAETMLRAGGSMAGGREWRGESEGGAEETKGGRVRRVRESAGEVGVGREQD